ncbi:MAG: thymidine phosphorylase [Paracoccaceae bacterium]|nr:thymidine phosphorylase [Paracoccaceae bacterium]
MDARSIIARLRDRQPLSREDTAWFAQGLADGRVSDAQAGAFAMAALLNGLGEEGRVALTLAMRDSGDTMEWDLPGPAIDKHSTGGIGDTVSLLLAPMLAAAGAFVPMISGRGLGHTGGTLDKLEAIRGVTTSVTQERFRELVRSHGAAIVAATGDLAPADRRLYGIRDVTATVESVDLITASILSKKLAAGLDALVLDVKVGSGAFLPGLAAAKALALSLVTTANGAGCRTAALLTDMDQPLAPAAGNALETRVALDVLTGAATHPRLTDLSVALSARLARLAGLDISDARLRETLSSGAAAERFGAMMAALGGPADLVERYGALLPAAPVTRPVPAPGAGFVAAIDGRALGEAAVHLGAGRLRGDDVIDPAVGLADLLPLCAPVEAGAPLAVVHAADEAGADAAVARVASAYQLSATAASAPPLVIEEIA